MTMVTSPFRLHLPRRTRFALCVIAAFALVALLVYGRSLGNGFVTLDDNMLILNNPTVTEFSPASVVKALTSYDPELYIPLTFLVYQVVYRTAGPWAPAYHALNLALHTGNALLVAWLVTLLCKRRSAGVLAGLLFLVHPLNTEAVAWAAALKDVLSTFLALASLIAYCLYRERGRASLYRTSLEFFALALLAKVSVIMLPAVLFLIDLLERRQWDRPALREKGPFIVLALVFGIIALVGKSVNPMPPTLWQTGLMATLSTYTYLQKFLLPLHLSVVYLFEGDVIFSPVFHLPILTYALLLLLTLLTLRRSRIVAFGLTFFLVCLIPTYFNFAKMDYYFASDRYPYVAMIGLLVVVAHGFARAADALRGRITAALPHILGAGIAVVFGLLAYGQSLVWHDGVTLFGNALLDHPHSFLAHYNQGIAYARQGEIPRAIASARAAWALRPHDTARLTIQVQLADFYRYAGGRGGYDRAISLYRQVLARDPFHVKAHLGLGSALTRIGRREEGRVEVESALKLDPDRVVDLLGIQLQSAR